MNKVCCGTISWTFKKRPLDDSAEWCGQVLAEVAQAGYDGVEMGARVESFGDDATGAVDAVRRLVDQNGLELVRISSGATLREKLHMIAACGASINMVGAGKRPGGQPSIEGIGDEAFKQVAADLDEEARVSREEFGLPTGLHNHLWTLAENRHEVDRILDAAPHLQLVLDTAHLQAGGGDPIAAIEHYGERICHVHLKDAHTSIFSPQPLTPGFVPLGEGNLKIDIPGCLRALARSGYSGWLGVELDMTDAPLADNARSRDFLRKCGY
ncbi:MAG: sugar phosphate isomerase/epimerase family protein [Planctomycetota bacterium]